VNFTEFAFWPQLAMGLLLIYFLRYSLGSWFNRPNSRFDRYYLAALSFYLLIQVDLLTASIFALILGLTWACIISLQGCSAKARVWVVGVGIALVLCPLLYYKYSRFILTQFVDFEPSALLIPAGISFYTFQNIALIIDASRLPKWRPKFIDFFNFCSFFPQVVAGPIERKSDLFQPLERFTFRLNLRTLHEGTPWVLLGLVYKLVIADNVGQFIDRDSFASAWPILLNTFAFGLKIYFDFCGYSLIAYGIAKFFAIDLTLNFRSPYLASNLKDFWRRWHITLSQWFKDYVYIPLGGRKTALWPLAMLSVFLVSGMWHGAGWGFLIWGLAHGIGCVINHSLKLPRIPIVLSWLLTQAFVFICWLPFYEVRPDILWDKFKTLLQPQAWSLQNMIIYGKSWPIGEAVTFGAVLSMAGLAFVFEFLAIKRSRLDYTMASSTLGVVVMVALIWFLGSTEINEFIYFAF
jgi:alginate O-acetyltransferase complex protein AlgI